VARDSGRREQLWFTLIAGLSAVAGLASAVFTDFQGLKEAIERTDTSVVVAGAAVVVSVAALVVDLAGRQASRHSGLAATRSREAFQEAAAQAVASAASLSAASPSADQPDVRRLRQVEALEVEVQDLIARADAAKATASLHEDDARRIARLLGAETESRLREEVGKLTTEHNKQIDELRRSGNRMALWTFVGGVVLGIIGNIAVAVWLG